MNFKMPLVAGALLILTTLVSCLSGTPVAVTLEPQLAPALAVSAASGLQPRLLGRYYAINARLQSNNTELKLEPNYDNFLYKPNGSQFPGFENWDSLELPRWWQKSTRSDWLRLTLTRDAVVGIISLQRPSWVDSSWAETKQPDGSYAYKKPFKAGELSLNAPDNPQEPYLVLFAESNAQASVYPGLSSNAPSGAALPKPNQSCPSWLNDLYSVAAPDAQSYKSWHPQIDPVYWCYFGHEHGSDPALVNLPGWALEYVARKNNDQAEIHEGFKGIAIRDEQNKLGWYINIHAETHDTHRVCTQKHTVVVIVTDLSMPASSYPANVLARVAYKGDFGASESTRDVAGVNPVITPPATGSMLGTCPDQQALADSLRPKPGDDPVFFKRIRVADIKDGKIENNGYENWQGGLNPTLGLSTVEWTGGSTQPRFKIDIRNPSTTCTDLTCTNAITNDSHGDERTLAVYGLHIKYTDTVRLLDPDGDGTFYTDVYGKTARQPADADAVKQFVKPGLNLAGPDGFYTTEDAWRGLYVKDIAGVPRIELENALSPTN